MFLITKFGLMPVELTGRSDRFASGQIRAVEVVFPEGFIPQQKFVVVADDCGRELEIFTFEDEPIYDISEHLPVKCVRCGQEKLPNMEVARELQMICDDCAEADPIGRG